MDKKDSDRKWWMAKGYPTKDSFADEDREINKKEKQLDEGSKEYDEVIIDLTRERISQEFDNITADELKGSIIIGAVAAFLGIVLTIHDYVQFLTTAVLIQNLFTTKSLAMLPILLMVGAFVCGSALVYAREKIRLVKPRETNNDYFKLDPTQLKKKLKEELIENFEFIEEQRKNSWLYINAGFILLIFGVGGIFITIFSITK